MKGPRPLRTTLRWAGAWPALAWWATFLIVPIAWIALASFGTRPEMGQGGLVTLAQPTFANYGAASSDVFVRVFLTTLRTAGLAAVLCILAGFPVAYAIAVHVPPRWRSLAMVLVILPFWTSFLLRTFAWRIVLAPEGALSQALQAMRVTEGPLLLLDTAAAVQLGLVYNYLPMAILPIYVALERIDRSLLGASQDLGARPFATLLTVTLPLALPGILGGLLMTFILSAGDYVVPTILGGTKGLMAGNLVATQILSAQDLPTGAAMAVLLVGLIACAVGVTGLILGFVALARRAGRLDLRPTP